MSWSCYDCAHLDKSKRIESESSFRYGCKDGYTCGWIIKGKGESAELKSMGCSDFAKAGEQIALFEEVSND